MPEPQKRKVVPKMGPLKLTSELTGFAKLSTLGGLESVDAPLDGRVPISRWVQRPLLAHG